MQATYTFTEQFKILLDSPQQIDFHIRSGDYFAFLATMMGFMEEALSVCAHDEIVDQQRKLARELRHDLRYVQANYQVSARPPEDIQIVPGKGNLMLK